MKKKILIALLLVMTIICSSFSVSAASFEAESSQFTTSGASEATEEQVQRGNSVKKADISTANRTEAEAYATIDPNSRATSWLYTTRYFYYYGQETNYSCGAACVKMALRNITGTTYSEAAVRTGCNTTSTAGTYLVDMVEYINEEQDYNFYVERYRQTKASMQEDLYEGITYWDAPPIIGVRETTANGWNYNLSAHFVIIYAVTSSQSTFAVTDPWSGYIGDNANRDISVSVNDLYTAYNAVNIGYMY